MENTGHDARELCLRRVQPRMRVVRIVKTSVRIGRAAVVRRPLADAPLQERCRPRHCLASRAHPALRELPARVGLAAEQVGDRHAAHLPRPIESIYCGVNSRDCLRKSHTAGRRDSYVPERREHRAHVAQDRICRPSESGRASGDGHQHDRRASGDDRLEQLHEERQLGAAT